MPGLRREDLPIASGWRAGYGSLPQIHPTPAYPPPPTHFAAGPSYFTAPPSPAPAPVQIPPMFAPPFGAFQPPGPPPPGTGLAGPLHGHFAGGYAPYPMGYHSYPIPTWQPPPQPFGFYGYPQFPGPPVPAPSGPTATPVPGQNLSGGMENGVSYLYPKNHAQVSVSFDGEKVWKEDGVRARFTRRKVHMGMSVKELMELMGAGGDEWVCTEVMEGGGGKWTKGTSIEYKEEKAKDAMEKFGWGKERTTWVVMHKK